MLNPKSSFQFVLLALLLCICQRLCTGQVPFPNQCPEVKVVEDFNLDRYMGIWYEYAKYPFVFEIGKKCMYARYENIGNGTVSVMNASINRLTGAKSNVTGKARVVSPGRLAVVFPRSSKQNFDKPNYLVLGTDYTSYVVVYSCSSFTPVAHTKIVWILTRERKPSEAAIAAAKKIIDDNHLPQSFLMETIQDNCPNVGDATNGDNDDADGGEATDIPKSDSTTDNTVMEVTTMDVLNAV